MATKWMTILLILWYPLTAHLPQRQIGAPSYLWACRGEVRIDGEPVKCSQDLSQRLEPGSLVEAGDGASALISDEMGRKVELGSKQKLFRVQPRPQSRNHPRWKTVLAVFDSVFGHRVGQTVLKGDQADGRPVPWLDFLDGEGPALSDWKGLVIWRNLPPYRPVVVRAVQDDQVVFGPQPLLEPIFDLSALNGLALRKIRLELLVLEGTPLPSSSTLSESPALLLSRPGRPVLAVLATDLFLESPQERSEALNRIEQFSAAPPLTRSAVTNWKGRLSLARRILAGEYGQELPLPWKRSLSGLQIWGSLTTDSITSAQPTESKECSTTSDPQQVWECFWNLLGSAVVPEIPLADLEAASRLFSLLQDLSPQDWRPAVAGAQVDLLLGHHRDARSKLAQARSQCQDDACVSTVDALEFIVVVDAYSSFDRQLDQWLINLNEGGHEGFQQRASESLLKTDPVVRQTAQIWFVASQVRIVRLGIMARRIAPWMVPPPDDTASPEKMFEEAVQSVNRVSPAFRFLQWSLDPSEPPPVFPKELRPAAALLHVEGLIAPNGGLASADISYQESAAKHIYYQVGGRLPQFLPLTNEQYQGAFACLLDQPGPANGLIASVSRLTALSFATFAQVRGEFDSRGLSRTAGLLASQAETLIPSPTPVSQVASLHILHGWMALSGEGRAEQALDHFESAFRMLKDSGSLGRASHALRSWVENARRTFHTASRYQDGIALLQQAALHAIDMRSLQSLGLIEEAVRMLKEIGLQSEVIALLPQAKAQIEQAEERLEGLPLPKESIHSILGSLRWGLANTEADTLSQLGAISALEENLSVISLLHDPQQAERLRLMYRIQRLQSVGEFGQAEKLMRESADLTVALMPSFLMDGEEEYLGQLESQINELERQIRNSPSEIKAETLITMQRLLHKREDYIAYCAQALTRRQVRKVLEGWTLDSLSSSIAQQQPWRQLLLEAQVLEAEGHVTDAKLKYDQLIAQLRKISASGQHRNRHYSFILGLERAFLGSARLELESNEARSRIRALDRLDELRWLEGQRKLGGITQQESPPFSSLANLAEHFGSGGTILCFTDTDRLPRTLMAWMITARGVNVRRFELGGIDSREAFSRAVMTQETDTGLAVAVSDWLAESIEPDAPVAIVTSVWYRGIRFHLFPVAGMPLALRNPVVIIPSLRALAEAQANQLAGRGTALIGMPLTVQDANRRQDDLGPLADKNEFARLSRDLRFGFDEKPLWNNEATVEAVSEALQSKARIHISAHGRVSPLNRHQTGIQLAGGRIFNLEHAKQVRIPGSLIILSACSSGAWASPGLGTVATLDQAFLHMGASNVVSTPLQVKPKPAALWMSSFHAALNEGKPPMEAARDAYRATREVFPAPEDWGAFTVVGSGTGRF